MYKRQEYAFEVAPGSDPSIVQMKYEGQNSQSIDEDGNLIIGTNLGDILESPPIAWTIKEGYKEKVEVLFKLEDGILSFEFPDEYDRSATLFIDPNLTFSTFTGSQADNWGMSATPDLNGNLFGGGSVFEFTSSNGTVPALYPTTVGAYSTAFNGGEIDVGITKFNDDGTAMIYSTYLGGAGEETPNSIVANDVGELYVFGITSSPNFPMAGTPFDNTYAGGPNVLGTQYGLGFTGGSDIYIARLSADGTTLLASTYVGGTDVDGMNESVLEYNYGDAFRGDITLDDNGNIYVASTTRSADFPIVGGSQAALQGTQDAVIFKMTPNLNLMIWSTFYGGSGEESGNSVRVAVNGDVLVCGGTNSNNLNVPGGHMTAYGGGLADAYVTRFNGTNSNVLSGTYAGSMDCLLYTSPSPRD